MSTKPKELNPQVWKNYRKSYKWSEQEQSTTVQFEHHEQHKQQTTSMSYFAQIPNPKSDVHTPRQEQKAVYRRLDLEAANQVENQVQHRWSVPVKEHDITHPEVGNDSFHLLDHVKYSRQPLMQKALSRQEHEHSMIGFHATNTFRQEHETLPQEHHINLPSTSRTSMRNLVEVPLSAQSSHETSEQSALQSAQTNQQAHLVYPDVPRHEPGRENRMQQRKARLAL